MSRVDYTSANHGVRLENRAEHLDGRGVCAETRRSPIPPKWERTCFYSPADRADPLPGFSGISECRVLEVVESRRLVHTWTVLHKAPDATPQPPMTVTWTLEPERGGTRLVLEQVGLEVLNWWWRFSMDMGWNRHLKKLLSRVLNHIRSGRFTRDYGTKTVPEGYAK